MTKARTGTVLYLYKVYKVSRV